MGTVYEAEETASGRRVALKLVAPGFAASPEAVARFHREGRLASMIAHPRCVFVLAADEEAGRPYIAMELMPGRTLADLVAEQGPLPPEQAVAKILDVIEGLQEAHRLQVLHRDVKPSNCFLESDGRVKIGDFGLSKSLVADAHLTQAGSFLGTPHFASPEQHKGEDIDLRSDVYAVAATLYFLLTGKPPFHPSDNLAAVAARKASEPAPPMRSLRPELPAALDHVVLRGLERDRERRWRNLDELRTALLPFVPGHLSIGAMGMRLAALMTDYLLWLLIDLLFGIVLFIVYSFNGGRPEQILPTIMEGVMEAVGWIGYFAIQEGVWGCTLGKRLLRLRVCTAGGPEAPGWARVLLRTFLFFCFLNLGGLLSTILAETAPREPEPGLLVNLLPLLWFLGGLGLITSTMRARNGYRGLHEFLSGTRVVQLPWPARRRHFRVDRPHRLLSRPDELPERIGPFVIRGTWRWSPGEKVLLAADPVLGREVCLWIHAPGDPPVSPARREIGRTTRLRWLAGGRQGEERWDAFLAPAGGPLADLMEKEGRLSWAEVRPLLEQLTDELTQAGKEGTVPNPLTIHQVWVEPSGRVLLLDFPLLPPAGASAALAETATALNLLRQVAILGLEGRPRPAGMSGGPIRAPLPGHASRILEQLLGIQSSYTSMDQVRADLAATQSRPTQMNRTLRGGHLALLAPLLAIGLLVVAFSIPALVLFWAINKWDLPKENVAGGGAEFDHGAWVIEAIAGLAALAALWVFWAFLFRGGLTFRMMGISVARSDGRTASRLRCAWRAFLVWAPVVVLYGLVVYAVSLAGTGEDNPPESSVVALAFGFLGVLGLGSLYLVLALVFPRRGPHDWAADTYLVPR
jgi:hypothetical protein